MTNFEKLYIELLDDKYEKGMKAGESQGRKIGKVEGIKKGEAKGIIQVAKEMVKNKMKDSDILKVTHISKQELEELKKKVVV